MLEIVNNVKRSAALVSPDKFPRQQPQEAKASAALNDQVLDTSSANGDNRLKTNSLLGSFKVNELSRRNNNNSNNLAPAAAAAVLIAPSTNKCNN